jgi:peptide/nickel transport system permease protein
VIPFALRRIAEMILTLFWVSVLVFLIYFVIPGGDPAVRIAGRTATAQNIQNIRQNLHLNDHLWTQWYYMMKSLFQGALVSYSDQTNVVQQIKLGLPATFSLVIGGAIIWLFFGILVGTISAVTAGRLSDRLITVLALIGISMPVFWVGIIFRYVLAEQRSLFPDGGYVALTSNPGEWLYHLILPWFTLAILFIGFYGRVLRSNILDTMNEDYVRTARAKGLSRRRVLIKHILRNSLIPVITLFGLDFGAALGGAAILTETVYNLHGVGQYAATAVTGLDLPPLIAVTMYGAFFIVAFTTLVDLAYAVLDPRIRPT